MVIGFSTLIMNYGIKYTTKPSRISLYVVVVQFLNSQLWQRIVWELNHKVYMNNEGEAGGCWWNWGLCLLFHLLGVVFNLISSLDDLIRSTVELVRDDLLKVLEDNKETKAGWVQHAHKPANGNNYAPWNLSQGSKALRQTSACTQVQVGRTHVSIIWVWWWFPPWACCIYYTRNLCYLNDQLRGDLPVTFPPCQAGWVQSGSSAGWPVLLGTLFPDPEERDHLESLRSHVSTGWMCC